MYEMRELVMSIKVLFQCRAAALLLGTAIAVAAAGVASAQAPVSAPAAPAASAPPSATPAAQPAAPAQAAPAAEASQPPSTPTIANASLPHDLSPWGMFLTADIVVKVVMVGLVFASLVTWTVWLAKNLELLKARRRARKAIAVLNEARTLAEANARLSQSNETVAQLLRTAIAEVQASPHPDPEALKERVSWLLERVEASASRRIGRGMGLLASIGAVAPFVGLFGTVWGIMNSFIGISNAHTTNLAVVAPGIAEALLATALGLFAAIPAVVIYNAFSRAIGGYRALLADGSALVMRLLSRDCERVSIPMSRAAE
jgi:biopolymer transport protein ExbB